MLMQGLCNLAAMFTQYSPNVHTMLMHCSCTVCAIFMQCSCNAIFPIFVMHSCYIVLFLLRASSNPEREELATIWIEWLCAHQADFGHNDKVNSSFGEMLLLIAIHFHSNNLEAITDLVTTTLSMKLKLGPLTKMKILFTQQLFPEKVSFVSNVLCIQLLSLFSSGV